MSTLPSVVPEAFVYDTLAAGTYAYSASSSGELTMIEGSPFQTTGTLIGTNGRFFLTQASGYVFAYQVESNGGIGRLISKIDTQLFSGSECGSSPPETELDRTGAHVYALLGGKGCYAIQTFEIGETGKLTFKGSTNPGDRDIVLPAVTGNNKFAYSLSSTEAVGGECCHFTSFARESTGVLKVINAHEANPAHKPGAAAYSPVSNPVPGTTDHFALTVEPQGGGPQQLASYTVDGEGNTSSTNTWENMPTLPDYVYDMVLDPTGRILAIATGQDIQFFHFNGAKPVTRFTGVAGIPGYIKKMAWDDHGHLYAQSSAGGEIYVYEVTTTSVKELSGSPTVIPQGAFVVRTK
jgi:WD40 repeat protein